MTTKARANGSQPADPLLTGIRRRHQLVRELEASEAEARRALRKVRADLAEARLDLDHYLRSVEDDAPLFDLAEAAAAPAAADPRGHCCNPCARRGMLMSATVVRDGIGLCDDCARHPRAPDAAEAGSAAPPPDVPLRSLQSIPTRLADRLDLCGFKTVAQLAAIPEIDREAHLYSAGLGSQADVNQVLGAVARALAAEAPLPVPPLQVPTGGVAGECSCGADRTGPSAEAHSPDCPAAAPGLKKARAKAAPKPRKVRPPKEERPS